MSKQQDYLFGCAAAQVREPNNYLIYDYRKIKIDKIPEYIDKGFHQVVKFFNNQVEYLGYRELTPEERIDYIVTNQLTKGAVNIRRTETTVMCYMLKFQDKIYNIYIDVPYLINERVVYNDTEYYPQFPIVEKGGINRTDNGTVIVKVMRVPITFGRRQSDKYKITSTKGNVYPEMIISVKIHQGANSGKKGDHIPSILYHLCKLGYNETMKLYKMQPSDVTITTTFDNNDPTYEYFMLPDGYRYLKVRSEVLGDCYTRRVVLALYKIYTEIQDFANSDVFTDDPSYYCAVLGKFIGSKDQNMTKLMLPNALKHLKMTDPMLDLVAQGQLKTVGCDCKDIYDLLYWMFYHIDDLMVTYDPTNLFDKKIESLDNLAGRPMRKIVLAQYHIINSKKAIMDARTVEQFCRRASQRASWIASAENERQSKVFRPNPSLCNGAYLLSIGMKRILSLESIASSFGRKNKKGSKSKASPDLLKAHYSQICVTSLLDIPASTPVITGSMNIYQPITEDGDIIRPDYADEIVHVFD